MSVSASERLDGNVLQWIVMQILIRVIDVGWFPEVESFERPEGRWQSGSWN